MSMERVTSKNEDCICSFFQLKDCICSYFQLSPLIHIFNSFPEHNSAIIINVSMLLGRPTEQVSAE